MMPLWMRASLPSSPRCGCAFRSFGAPCVAQRVWPMPVRAVRDRGWLEVVEQHLQLAGALAGGHRAVRADHRDARGVVSAVLEALESAEQHLETLVAADVTHDSTHGLDSRPAAAGARLGAMSDPGARNGNGENGHVSPFLEIDRDDWAALAPTVRAPLTETEIAELRGLGEPLDLIEVEQVYLPLSRLLAIYAESSQYLHGATSEFLGTETQRTPVRHRRRRVGRGRQDHGLPAAARAPVAVGGHAPGRAGHDGRVPAAERGAGAPRHPRAQGLPRVLRPPRAAAVRERGEERQVAGERSVLLAPLLRHRPTRS